VPEVHADAALLESGEVLGDLIGGNGCAALAADAGGHTPSSSCFGETVLRQAQRTGLVMTSIQPGRNVTSRGVDLLTVRVQFTFADTREAAVFDRDVSENPGIAGAVKHAAVANYDVVDRLSLLRGEQA
jgi:hypothetical protein